eukprot:358098-Chlamydomonas_euryale.AAC.2
MSACCCVPSLACTCSAYALVSALVSSPAVLSASSAASSSRSRSWAARQHGRACKCMRACLWPAKRAHMREQARRCAGASASSEIEAPSCKTMPQLLQSKDPALQSKPSNSKPSSKLYNASPQATGHKHKALNSSPQARRSKLQHACAQRRACAGETRCGHD